VAPARYPLWLQSGVSVIAGLCLIVAVRSYREADAYGRTYQDPYMINAQPERLREAARLLPEKSVVGYLSDLPLSDTPGQAAYFGVASFLAPRLVVRDPDNPAWVIGNFSRPQDYAAAGAVHRLEFVRDLGNGVVLFRRGAQ
jgi:hypothetical protein